VSDRYAAMQWPFDGPCPTCGQHPDGIPTYRPRHAKAISDEARQRHLAFADTRPPDGGAAK